MFQTLLSTIDLRSFSNVWFWIVLVVAWSSFTSTLLGIPADMVYRARRQGGQAMIDLETMALLQAQRRQNLLRQSGPFSAAIWTGLLTTSVVLGFVYWLELGQALSLLLIPLALGHLSGLPLIRRIAQGTLGGESLLRAIRWHRFWMMMLGLFAIMVTTLWGMFYNVVVPVLGR